jgi:hypothetical protein
MSTAPAAARPPAPTIHEAERATDLSGAILWGMEIDIPAAVARRQNGADVVVRGDDVDANRHAATTIEAAVGPYQRGAPHKQTAGPLALPHFQQRSPPPAGHTFYETDKRKARKRS